MTHLTHLTQLQRRAQYARTHDIYGNDPDSQLIIAEMMAKAEEYRRDQAAEQRAAWPDFDGTFRRVCR